MVSVRPPESLPDDAKRMPLVKSENSDRLGRSPQRRVWRPASGDRRVLCRPRRAPAGAPLAPRGVMPGARVRRSILWRRRRRRPCRRAARSGSRRCRGRAGRSRQLRLRFQRVEQPVGDAAMQRADDLLVLAHRLAVGAVAQPVGQRSGESASRSGWKPSEASVACIRLLRRLGLARGRARGRSRDRRLDSRRRPARGDHAGEPAAEVGVSARRVAAGPAASGAIAHMSRGRPRRLRRAFACDEPGLETFEVHADAVGVQAQLRAASSSVVAGRRSSFETREQPRAGRLGERVIRPRRDVHQHEFYTARLGKLASLGIFPSTV